MTWIDLVLLLTVILTTALSAERRLTGFVLGLGAALLLKPLLLLGSVSVFGALLAALAAGVLLSLLGTWLARSFRLPDGTNLLLGAAGGLLLSTALLLASVTALPIERNAHGQIVYPPQQGVTRSFAAVLKSSSFVNLGRNILLYPLLAAGGDASVSGSDGFAYAWLHDYLVAGTPWQ
jgi:hypothetical protein